MRQRIQLHQLRRDDRWQTFEAPFELVEVIEQAATKDAIILVDCLTLWLSNLILAERENDAHIKALCALIAHPPCDLVLVSNEVGLGIVPDNALARRFRDKAGLLNQHVATVAKRVYLVTAGLPLCLKE